jgi:xylitol oxidase
MLETNKQKVIHVLGRRCSFQFSQTNSLKTETSVSYQTHDQEQMISTVTCDLLIDMTLMNKVIELNLSSMEITVEAGITYSELIQYLASQGLALSDISAYPDVTVGGASSTGTHGSGNQILSQQFVSMDIVTGAGEIHKLNDAKMFTHLGVLGIVATVTLRCVKMFYLKQSVYLLERWSLLKPFLLEMVRDAEIFSSMLRINLDNSQHSVLMYIRKIASGIDDQFHEQDYMGGKLFSGDVVHCYGGIGTNEKTTFTDTYWNVIADHSTLFKGHLLGIGKYFQAEYFVSIDCASEAIDSLLLITHEFPMFCEALPSGIKCRFVKSDQQLMSPCYNADGTTDYFLAIQLSLYANEITAKQILVKVEAALRDFHPTTHWGKLCANPVEFYHLYQERFREMDKLRKALDPHNCFIDSGSYLYKAFKGVIR